MGVTKVHGQISSADYQNIFGATKLAVPAAGRKYEVVKEDFKVKHIVTKPVEFLNNLFSATKGADKTLKVGVDATKVAKASMEVANATSHAAYGVFSSVGSALGGFCKIISPMNVLFDLNVMVNGFSKMHWTEKVSMTCVTISDALVTGCFAWTDLKIGSLVQFTVNGIAKAAGCAGRIGNGLSVIPIVNLVANTILVPASVFGIANDAIKLDAVNKKSAKQASELGAKILKWEGFAQDNVDFRQLYLDKIGQRAVCRTEVIALEEVKNRTKEQDTELKTKKEFLEKADGKMDKWTQYAEALKDKSKGVLFHNRAVVKVEKYNESLAAAKYNANTNKATSWLSIADNVMKLVLGVLGIVVTVVGMATGVALPAVAVVLAAGWLVDHVVGLTKHLIPMFRPNIDLVEKVSIPMTEILAQATVTPDETKTEDAA